MGINNDNVDSVYFRIYLQICTKTLFCVTFNALLNRYIKIVYSNVGHGFFCNDSIKHQK